MDTHAVRQPGACVRGLAASLVIAAASSAAPPNDNCESAAPLTDAVTPFCTIGATTDGPPLPPGCDEGGGLSFVADIWFAYAMPLDGSVCFSTCGVADFDTRIAVYRGACGDPSLIACNDDAQGCGMQSQVSVAGVAGETLLVRVGGFAASGCGSLLAQIATCPTCPPSAHDCATPGGPGCTDADCCLAVCAVDASCCATAWDELCVEATLEVVACGASQYECLAPSDAIPNDCAPGCLHLSQLASVSFDTTTASTDGPPTGCPYEKDIWFCIAAPSTGQLEVTVSEASFDPVVVLYDVGTSDAFDPNLLPDRLLQCGDARHDGSESIYLASTDVGHVYLVQVAGSLAQGLATSGGGTLTVRFAVPLVNTGPTLPALYDPNAQAAFTLTDVGFFTGTASAGATGATLFVQAFTLPDSGSKENWSINELHVAGCLPGSPGCVAACAPGGDGCSPPSVENDLLVVTVWNRVGLEPPADGDQVTTIALPFPTPSQLADTAVDNEDIGAKLTPALELAPGDYWFTAYATHPFEDVGPAGFVWLTNASGDVIPVPGDQGSAVFRAEHFPLTPFVSFALDAGTQLASAPGDDPKGLYSQGFRLLGQLGELSICDRIRAKITDAQAKLERVLEKEADLGIGDQSQLQQLTQQMHEQTAQARGLLEDAKAQASGLGASGVSGASCPGIDVAGVVAKTGQASGCLSAMLGVLGTLIGDADVTPAELDDSLKVLDAELTSALLLIELAAQDASSCPADLTGDGVVNGADLAELLSRWGQPGTGDFNESGAVDGGDLTVMLGSWGGC